MQLLEAVWKLLTNLISINVSQVLGAPVSLVNQEWYNSWISYTKKSFAVLTMTMTERWAPTVVKVSGDASMRGQLFQSSKGELLCNFPRRLVMIANHQIYTDWLYLWWIAYSNGMHGRIYIILKESLKRIPVIGWGMQLCQFIFLKRNWEADKPNMASHLKRLNKIEDPMWLVLFPEGTNLAPSTREASGKWARKNGINDLRHTLLPRATGLQFCIQELEDTLGYVYDCTIAYEGVPRGQYAQDIYTLSASYVEGKPPKCVNMYWRRFAISAIPVHDERAFELWLRARWMEKDALIEKFHRNGQFPADTGTEKGPSGRTRRGAGYINSTIKANRWHEFLTAFMPMGLLSLVLYSFYGSIPEAFLKNMQTRSVMDNVSQLQQVPPAQKEAVLRAASEATGVKKVNVQKALPIPQTNQILKQPAAKMTAAQKQAALAQWAKTHPSKTSRTQAQRGVRRGLVVSQVTNATSTSKKAPKLGPRSQSASVAPSSAASTVGSAPKLGPRKQQASVNPVQKSTTTNTVSNAQAKMTSSGKIQTSSKKTAAPKNGPNQSQSKGQSTKPPVQNGNTKKISATKLTKAS